MDNLYHKFKIYIKTQSTSQPACSSSSSSSQESPVGKLLHFEHHVCSSSPAVFCALRCLFPAKLPGADYR